MLGLINWRLKVTINDGRAFIGQMLAFDKHMNLVLADCEEFRHVRPKKKAGESESGPEQEMKRSLGLVILRGETVVSLSVEGPPPVQDEDKKNAVCASAASNSREIDLNLSFFSCISASCWPWSRDASWAWNGNGASLCVLYTCPYEFSIGGDCHLLLHLHSLTAGPPAFARPPMPFAPPGMPGAPPGFRPPGFPPGVPFPPPPGFGGPPPG
jgi:small nuclear ribonucleoprotein B and B'